MLRLVAGRNVDVEAAWAEVRARLDLDDPGRSHFTLLPALARRLETLGIDAPQRERLQGIYKRAWYGNTLLLGRLEPLTRALTADGVEVLLTGGAAIAAAFARDPGLRPIEQADVVVRGESERARPILEGNGWKPASPPGEAQAFSGPDGAELVLHTRLLPDFPADAGTDAELVDPASTRTREGIQARFLTPTGELLAALLDRYRREEWRRAEWVLDAALVLGRSAPDADLLVRQARERDAVETTRQALEYLRRLLGFDELAAAVEALAAADVGRRERLATRLDAAAGAPLGQAPARIAAHVRGRKDASAPRALLSSLRLLRDEWGLRSVVLVPLAAAGKGAGRLVRRRPSK